MSLILITAPTDMPVSVDEAKEHLRIDNGDDDLLLRTYLLAATAYVDGKEGLLQRALKPQTWELTMDQFPGAAPWNSFGGYGDYSSMRGYGAYNDYSSMLSCGDIAIPLPPLLSVDSVKYTDTDGVVQTVDPANYMVDGVSVPSRVSPITGYTWPATKTIVNAVRVRFTAGYLDGGMTTTVPPAITVAILLMVGSLYENRESLSKDHLVEISTVKSLLSPYQVPVLA